MPVSDHELIRGARAGNAAAFEQLVYRYDEKVLALALRYVGSRDDAKDIYQEVFVRVYRALGSFRMESEFSTWLYRITVNVCLSHKSDRKRRPEASPGEGPRDARDIAAIPAEDASADERMHAAEIASRVAGAVERLSPKQRLVFTLRHYQGHKLREIASMMECTEGTVKRYLFAATQKMREELKELAAS
jgi:RNA polymerase sigma-70 factor (ECF subfamily)